MRLIINNYLFAFIVITLLFNSYIVQASPPEKMRCGGFGKVKEVDASIQAILDGVKASVDQSLGHSPSTFTAISYASQVVAGTNYIIKVDTGADKYIHVKVHKPLPHTVIILISPLFFVLLIYLIEVETSFFNIKYDICPHQQQPPVLMAVKENESKDSSIEYFE